MSYAVCSRCGHVSSTCDETGDCYACRSGGGPARRPRKPPAQRPCASCGATIDAPARYCGLCRDQRRNRQSTKRR